MDEVKAFIERMKQLHGDEVRGVQFPEGVDEYMRDRVLAGDLETVSFMHRLAWIFGMQTGQAALLAQQEREAEAPVKKRIEA
jgi:hypothetical protein